MSTLSYEVTIILSDLALADQFEAYMATTHVGEVFATGCFLDARFEKAREGLYRSRYTVATQADLDCYLSEHAPALRTDFHEHFPSGVSLSREVWTPLASFSGSQR